MFIEAENAVLGAILRDGKNYARVANLLQSMDFQAPINKKIFAVMTDFFVSGKPIDPITIAAKIPDDNAALISELINNPGADSRIAFYAKQVKAESSKIKILEINQECEERLLKFDKEKDDVYEIAKDAIAALMSIQKANSKKAVKIGQVLQESLQELDEGKLKGLSTGFQNIDKIVPGFCPGDFIIIGGRPSMGKTALALNFAINQAKIVPAGYCSIEMANRRIGERYIKRTKASRKFMNQIHELPLYVDDNPSQSVVQCAGRIMEMYYNNNIKIAYVDYLQLMSEKQPSRNLEVGFMSKTLKNLARVLDIPIVALSQLSRDVDKRRDKRPVLADLRDSGCLEADADIVIFPYREDYQQKDATNKAEFEVIIAKQKNGPLGIAKLIFDKELTIFHDMKEENLPDDRYEWQEVKNFF